MPRTILSVLSASLILISAHAQAGGGSVLIAGSGYSSGYGLSTYTSKGSGWRNTGRVGHEYQTYRVIGGQRNHGYTHHRPRWPAYGYGYKFGGSYGGVALSADYYGYDTSYYRTVNRYYVPYQTLNGYSYTVYPQNIEINAHDVSIDIPQSGNRRTLLKTADGLCYQIHKNSAGDELRIQLDDRECNW